jgi:hypothetical protein
LCRLSGRRRHAAKPQPSDWCQAERAAKLQHVGLRLARYPDQRIDTALTGLGRDERTSSARLAHASQGPKAATAQAGEQVFAELTSDTRCRRKIDLTVFPEPAIDDRVDDEFIFVIADADDGRTSIANRVCANFDIS